MSVEQHRFGQFALAISRIHQCIQRLKTAEIQEYGLKAVHVMCLYLLYRSPQGLSSVELVEQTGEDKAAISRALKQLREKSFVEPVPEKLARSYKNPAILTPAGVQVASEITETIHRIFAENAPAATEEELAVFYRVLMQVSDNLMTYSQRTIAKEQK